MVEIADLAEFDSAFREVSSRSGPIDALHHAVNRSARNLSFGLYRDFPDDWRERRARDSDGPHVLPPEIPDPVKIRPAHSEDLPRLLEIYNHYVEHTHVTFDIERLSLDERRGWLDGFDRSGPHRLYVAERAHWVEGYASSRIFRARAAYDRSVETSVYLDPAACGKGVGSALYGSLLDELETEPLVHRAYGGVALPNEASVALHLRLGFKRVGSFSEVGFKFGRYWDVAWFERSL